MRVLVKRFCLSYGRRIYKAGEVVDIADNKAANDLIARSGGDLEACGSIPGTPAADAPTNSGGVASLPAVDPLEAIQGEKPKGRKK